MSDDLDLYDDLPLVNFGESVSKIDEERKFFKKQLDEKEKDLHEIKERFEVLEKEKNNLEVNISSLFKTAVNELKRKDRVIDELRREKESLIFRRKSHSISSNIDNSSLDDNFHQVSTLPAKTTSVSEENNVVESVKSESSSCNSNVSKSIIEKLYESASYQPNEFKEPDCLSKCSENSLHVQEGNEVFCDKASDNVNNVQAHSSVSENTRLKTDDVSSDNLSSCSSYSLRHKSYKSELKEQSWDPTLSKYERERRSLSSEDRRDNNHKQNSHYSQKYRSPRNRHESPHNRHRTYGSHNEKSRKDDRQWDHDDYRKYKRDFFKEIDPREKKFSAGSSNELWGKHYMHSRRSPSPQWSRRYPHNTNQGYSDRRDSSKVNRSFRPQSDNVRLATQLKSKYSKAMRERSASRTPVKQSALSRYVASKESKSEFSKDAIPELNMNETMICSEDAEDPVSRNKSCTETSRLCTCDKSPSDYFSDQKLNCENCNKKKLEIGDYSTAGNIREDQTSNCEQTLKQTRKIQCDVSPVSVLVKNTVRNQTYECKDKYSEILKMSSTNLVDTNMLDHTSDKSQNTNAKKNEKLKDGSVWLANVNYPQKFQTNSEHNSYAHCEDMKSAPRVNEDHVNTSRNEENLHKEFPSLMLRTPPNKTHIPLKISPTFEDPAIVKENKFSICIFNEQCEFSRPRRKRSVKLLVTEVDNTCSTENSKKDCKERKHGQNFKSGVVSAKQKMDSHGLVGDDSMQDCTYDKNSRVNIQNVKEMEVGHISKNSLSDVHGNSGIGNAENSFNIQETTLLCSDVNTELDLKCMSLNISQKLPEREVCINKIPSKKRKLDSICEELKANLHKRKVTSSIESVPVYDTNIESQLHKQKGPSNNINECKKNINTVFVADNDTKCEMKSNETNQPKRIIVSKFRRRVHNLQDSVVQVSPPVKSRLS